MAVEINNVADHKDKRGWLCGQFFPPESHLHTSTMEVRYFELLPGDTDAEHYHPQGVELVLILLGKVRWRIDGVEHELHSGDYYLSAAQTPEEIVEIIEPCKGVAVRAPSVSDNKVYINK